MSEELQKIVDEYREKEIHISDEEAEQILWLCNRKMDICKIENREEYLPLLFNCSVCRSSIREHEIKQSQLDEQIKADVQDSQGLI